MKNMKTKNTYTFITYLFLLILNIFLNPYLLANLKNIELSEIEKNKIDKLEKDNLQNDIYILGRGDHLSLETWEGWTFLAAENIEGINSVIWKYSEPGNDIYWLSHHDENWEFTHTSDPGFGGDSISAPNATFYKTEFNFNFDLPTIWIL